MAFCGKNFNDDTHQNTAYTEAVDAIKTEFEDDAVGGDTVVWSKPIQIKAGFKCEEELEWEVQMYPNNLGNLIDQLGGQQFFAVLMARLTSIKKPKARVTGGFRVIAPPDDEDEDAMEEEQQDGG